MTDRKTPWTPGPYRAEGPDRFGDYNIMHEACSLAIGVVASNLHRPAEEIAANALLFAEAPAMAGLLELTTNCLDAATTGGDWSPSQVRAAVAEARALLTRIRGDAQ